MRRKIQITGLHIRTNLHSFQFSDAIIKKYFLVRRVNRLPVLLYLRLSKPGIFNKIIKNTRIYYKVIHVPIQMTIHRMPAEQDRGEISSLQMYLWKQSVLQKYTGKTSPLQMYPGETSLLQKYPGRTPPFQVYPDAAALPIFPGKTGTLQMFFGKIPVLQRYRGLFSGLKNNIRIYKKISRLPAQINTHHMFAEQDKRETADLQINQGETSPLQVYPEKTSLLQKHPGETPHIQVYPEAAALPEFPGKTSALNIHPGKTGALQVFPGKMPALQRYKDFFPGMKHSTRVFNKIHRVLKTMTTQRIHMEQGKGPVVLQQTADTRVLLSIIKDNFHTKSPVFRGDVYGSMDEHLYVHKQDEIIKEIENLKKIIAETGRIGTERVNDRASGAGSETKKYPDINRLSDQVYYAIKQKIRRERERKGL